VVERKMSMTLSERIMQSSDSLNDHWRVTCIIIATWNILSGPLGMSEKDCRRLEASFSRDRYRLRIGKDTAESCHI
jgi:hypothetical protein